jgi:hypothetical protein
MAVGMTEREHVPSFPCRREPIANACHQQSAPAPYRVVESNLLARFVTMLRRIQASRSVLHGDERPGDELLLIASQDRQRVIPVVACEAYKSTSTPGAPSATNPLSLKGRRITMIDPRVIERLLQLIAQVIEAHTTAALCLDEVRAELAELSAELSLPTIVHRLPSADQKLVRRPMVDESTCVVSWNGRRCFLGHTMLLRLMCRLCRRPNQYVSHQQLLDDVWGDERTVDTIRSVVRQLRAKLRTAGMGEVARAIRADQSHYGLMLDELE